MKRLVACLFASCLPFLHPLAAEPGAGGLKLHYTTVTTAKEVMGETRTSTERSTIFMDGSGRERIESRTSDGRLRITISDLRAGTFFELDPVARRGARRRHPGEEESARATSASGGRRPTHARGTRIIQGLECDARGDGDRLEVAFCVEPTTGLSIIGAETIHLPFAEIRKTLERVEVLDLDPALFIVPDDYTIVED